VATYRSNDLYLDHLVSDVASWAGVALAIVGSLYFIYIWWADRFRVSI